MSAASLDNYGAQIPQKRQIQDERTRILDTVSRKAQEQTLTLQETTALYEKFNHTYSAKNTTETQHVDERWALELLEESEQEDIVKAYENTSFQTRINGIPHQATQSSHNSMNTKPSPANDAIIVEDNSKLSRTVIVDSQHIQQSIDEYFRTPNKGAQQDKALASIIVASGVATLSILLGLAWFL